MKNKLTIYSLLSFISLLLVAFIFSFDLVGAIVSLAESIQILSENEIQGLEAILATSVLEVLACLACLVLAFLKSRKLKKGTYDNGRLVYEVTAIFYTVLAISLIIVLVTFGIVDAGILTLAILILLVSIYNVYLIFYKNKLNAGLARILTIVADILDFVFIILLLVTYLNSTTTAILAGVFLLILYLINLTIDIIRLFNKSILDKVISNADTIEEKPLEVKEEQKEDKAE